MMQFSLNAKNGDTDGVSLKVQQPEELVAKAGEDGCPNSLRKSKLSLPPPFFFYLGPQ